MLYSFSCLVSLLELDKVDCQTQSSDGKSSPGMLAKLTTVVSFNRGTLSLKRFILFCLSAFAGSVPVGPLTVIIKPWCSQVVLYYMCCNVTVHTSALVKLLLMSLTAWPKRTGSHVLRSVVVGNIAITNEAFTDTDPSTEIRRRFSSGCFEKRNPEV